MEKTKNFSNSNLFEKITGAIVAILFLVLGVLLVLRGVVWGGMACLKGVIDKAESGKEKYYATLYAFLFGGTILLAFLLFYVLSVFLKPSDNLKIFSAVITFVFLLTIILIAKYKKF